MPPGSQEANKNIDTETDNMQTVVSDDNVTLCLWANLKYNTSLFRNESALFTAATQERVRFVLFGFSLELTT